MTSKFQQIEKKWQNCQNAKIRNVKILQGIPLHLEIIQYPIFKPKRRILGS